MQAVGGIGGRHEGRGELLDFGIGPNQLAVSDAIPSGAAERMPVHRPEQNRFLLFLTFDHRVPITRAPRNFGITQLRRRGQDAVPPLLKIAVVQFDRATHADGGQYGNPAQPFHKAECLAASPGGARR